MNMIEVCCALIFHAGQLLAVQRGSGKDHPFQWEFPGGKVEPKEDFQACIIREIKEELMLEITPIRQLKSVIHQYPNKLIRLIPWIIEIESSSIHLTEHAQSKWLKEYELDFQNWQDADRELIELNKVEILSYFRKNYENN